MSRPSVRWILRPAFRQNLANPALIRPRSVRDDVAPAGSDQLALHRGGLEPGLLPCLPGRPGLWELAGSVLMPGECDLGAGGLLAEPRTMVKKPMRGFTGSAPHYPGQLRQVGYQRMSPSAVPTLARRRSGQAGSGGCAPGRCRRSGASWPSRGRGQRPEGGSGADPAARRAGARAVAGLASYLQAVPRHRQP